MEEDIKILENLASRTRVIAEDLETAVCSIDEQLAIRNLIARNKKYSELIIKLRHLSSGVVSCDKINGKKYYGPRKNFSKQRLYEQFLKMQMLLKSKYIFLSDKDYLKDLEKED